MVAVTTQQHQQHQQHQQQQQQQKQQLVPPLSSYIHTSTAVVTKAPTVSDNEQPSHSSLVISKPVSGSAATEEKEEAIISKKHKGIRAPLAWDKLKSLIDSHSDNVEQFLGRSYETQQMYERHIKAVKANYGSVANYLTSHTLADFIRTEERPRSSSILPEDLYITLNDFPYSLADAAEHWVMWSRKRLEPGFNPPPIVLDIIRDKFGSSIEWRYMVNPPALQSVKELYHAHLFIKRLG
ncbi:hypothetical protein EV182_004562 [Spiromyces aspiralis]|uniref:Uncharacterized protein n=1 Tax=Spiromyces aspiralis TaxID=68401 RepID=A0ACC1HCS9_9FUNG|nr:hypothetical protein EV182_004562 [Spiromyces aspiralis]